ncbi:MAG TPA: OsmC family protein [Streptosporangiaceae bacterium]|jgi:uncharacterized OsmC-like protein
MRNGLNTAGVSETVHELRERPEHAIADYAVAGPARPDGDGVLHTRALTMRDGVTRVARDFRLRQRPFGRPPDDLPTPYETALAALGACVLITNVNGYTARGVTLGALRITVRADLTPAAGAPLSGIRWHCAIDCDAPPETVRSINRLVCAFSPNHRLFLDASPIEVAASVHRSDGRTTAIPVTRAPAQPSAPPPAQPVAPCPLEAEVTWEYGSEATYRTALTSHGATRWTAPLIVDQPKQMLGIDKGPNSQEILLSALGAELAHLVADESAARGVPLHDAHLRLSGRLDTRGMLNVLREVSSSFHNLQVDASLHSDAPAGDLRDLLNAALTRAVLPATLASPQVIAVGLARSGTRELAYDSTTAGAESVRDDVTRRQQEAAAEA